MCVWGGGGGGEKHGGDIYKVPGFNRAIVSLREILSATEQKSVNLKKRGGLGSNYFRLLGHIVCVDIQS